MVSVDSDFGSQPMTIQGRRRSGRWRFKSVAVTTDCDSGEPSPSESGRDRRREVTDVKVENSCGRPVRSIILAPFTACDADVEGIPATMRCRRGSTAHLSTMDRSVRISPRSLVPTREGSFCEVEFPDSGSVRARCRSSKIKRASIAVCSCKDSRDAFSAVESWFNRAR